MASSSSLSWHGVSRRIFFLIALFVPTGEMLLRYFSVVEQYGQQQWRQVVDHEEINDNIINKNDKNIIPPATSNNKEEIFLLNSTTIDHVNSSSNNKSIITNATTSSNNNIEEEEKEEEEEGSKEKISSPLLAVATTTTTTAAAAAPQLPTAILHIGPHKTGSSSIQTLTKRFMNELKMDNYEMPWAAVTRSKPNQVQLATCFYNQPFVHPVFPCDKRLVEEGRNIVELRQNGMLISAEAFDKPQVNMTHLKEYLSPWNVTVVYVYRRFYSWLQSLHNEVTKNIKLEYFQANSTDYLRTNITDFITQVISRNVTDYLSMYKALERYNVAFENIVTLNMEDKNNYNNTAGGGDITQQFFCKAMPRAENTCDAMTKYAKTRKKIQDNASRVLTYHDLAYRAHRLGLINITSQKQLNTAVQLIQQHQTKTLKLSDTDFHFVCPDRPLLDLLLEISLEMEQWMVPKFFASPWGESKLRADFAQRANSSLGLCPVDISRTLRSREWVDFMSSLNEKLKQI